METSDMIVPIYQRGNMSAMVYIVWLSSASTVSVVVGCYTWIRAVWFMNEWNNIVFCISTEPRVWLSIMFFLDALTLGFFFILHKPIVIIYMHTHQAQGFCSSNRVLETPTLEAIVVHLTINPSTQGKLKIQWAGKLSVLRALRLCQL